MATLTEVFLCLFLGCKANARVKPAKTWHGSLSSKIFYCSTYRLFCVVLCIVCVYMCTVLLPPGGYPIAVKYIISYHISYHTIHISSYHISYHISYRVVSYHVISYHISYIISYHIIYHISNHIISYHIISYWEKHLERTEDSPTAAEKDRIHSELQTEV
jgi:hypothetical protein